MAREAAAGAGGSSSWSWYILEPSEDVFMKGSLESNPPVAELMRRDVRERGLLSTRWPFDSYSTGRHR